MRCFLQNIGGGWPEAGHQVAKPVLTPGIPLWTTSHSLVKQGLGQGLNQHQARNVLQIKDWIRSELYLLAWPDLRDFRKISWKKLKRTQVKINSFGLIKIKREKNTGQNQRCGTGSYVLVGSGPGSRIKVPVAFRIYFLCRSLGFTQKRPALHCNIGC